MTDYVKEYHSAVDGVGGQEVDDMEPMPRYESDGSIAVQHDINDGIIEDFEGADVVYAEPAWRDGYETFMAKADKGTAERGFERYMMNLNTAIRELDIPAYVIGGKNNLGWLKPDDIHELYFESHNIDAYCLLYNDADFDRYETETVADVLHHVADTYQWALDPCAGNGRLARAMVDYDKNFICADVNGKCIRFIAKDVMDYT